MITKLSKLLLNRYDYVLKDYIVSEPKMKQSKWRMYCYGIFFIITILYILEIAGVVAIGMNGLLFFLAFVLLFAYPIATNNINNTELLVITPQLLIQRISKKDFIVIPYDEVTAFNIENTYISIYKDEEVITFDSVAYEEYAAIIIEILETKGKTFDKEKSYMIRPVSVVIENRNIKIKDIKQQETAVESITGNLLKKYTALTPGFIEEIIPKDSVVDNASFKGKDLYLEFSYLEIKENHPENTTFEHQIALDCIMVFHNATLKSLAKRDGNDRSVPYRDYKPDPKVFVRTIKKGVISEWKYSPNEVLLILSIGVESMKVEFTYDDVLIGWKKIKK